MNHTVVCYNIYNNKKQNRGDFNS